MAATNLGCIVKLCLDNGISIGRSQAVWHSSSSSVTNLKAMTRAVEKGRGGGGVGKVGRVGTGVEVGVKGGRGKFKDWIGEQAICKTQRGSIEAGEGEGKG